MARLADRLPALSPRAAALSALLLVGVLELLRRLELGPPLPGLLAIAFVAIAASRCGVRVGLIAAGVVAAYAGCLAALGGSEGVTASAAALITGVLALLLLALALGGLRDRRIELIERMEGALDASRRADTRAQAILSAALDAIVMMDHRGVVTEFSPAAERTFGWSREAAIGRSMADLIIPPALRDAHREGLRRYMATGEASVLGRRIEVPALRADGSEFPAELTVVRIAGSEPPQFVGFVRDVTALVRSREQLESARDAAEASSNAKNVFLSRMSHELRTPLNAVIGFAQLIDLERLDGEDREGVANILAAGDLLTSLIDDALDVSRIEAGELSVSIQPVDARALLAEVVAIMAPNAAQHGVALELDHGPAELWVPADRNRAKQVLLNLVSNALRHGHGAPVRVWGRPAGASVRLGVDDDGPGIPVADRERIFEPFERLDPARGEGVGLGLALSRMLAEAMGGRVGVGGEPGRGSSFFLELAGADPPSAAAAAEDDGAVESGAPARARGSVLYVEDNAANVRVVERIVSSLGDVELATAGDGREGLRRALADPPDLVLLDLNLPDVDGGTVLARLAADPRTRSVPVVVISADALADTRSRVLAAGAHAYLTKPIDTAALARLTATVLTDRAGSPPARAAAGAPAGGDARR